MNSENPQLLGGHTNGYNVSENVSTENRDKRIEIRDIENRDKSADKEESSLCCCLLRKRV